MKSCNTHITLIGLLLCMVLTACKTNNGDIGPWYGVWALEQVEVDGKADTSWQLPGYDTNFQFQNNIVVIAQQNLLGDYTQSVGTWTEDGRSVIFDFTHSSDDFKPGTGIYHAPSWILMDNGVTACNIDHYSKRKMILSFVNSNGQHITYTLYKTF